MDLAAKLLVLLIALIGCGGFVWALCRIVDEIRDQRPLLTCGRVLALTLLLSACWMIFEALAILWPLADGIRNLGAQLRLVVWLFCLAFLLHFRTQGHVRIAGFIVAIAWLPFVLVLLPGIPESGLQQHVLPILTIVAACCGIWLCELIWFHLRPADRPSWTLLLAATSLMFVTDIFFGLLVLFSVSVDSISQGALLVFPMMTGLCWGLLLKRPHVRLVEVLGGSLPALSFNTLWAATGFLVILLLLTFVGSLLGVASLSILRTMLFALAGLVVVGYVLHLPVVRAGIPILDQWMPQETSPRDADFQHAQARLFDPEGPHRVGSSLYQRIEQSFRTLFPDGRIDIWLYERPDRFGRLHAAKVNSKTASTTMLDAITDPELAIAIEQSNLLDRSDLSNYYDAMGLWPDWLAASSPEQWVLPLRHQTMTIGFVSIATETSLSGIDTAGRDQLAMLQHQAAILICHALQSETLAQSAPFRAIAENVAIHTHDLKNIGHQMSLLADNAERHGHNPEFREDMVSLLRTMSHRLDGLMARISGKSPDTVPDVTLRTLISEIADIAADPRLIIVDRVGEELCPVDPDRLSAILWNLVDNGLKAVSGEEGRVWLSASIEESMLTIQIVDNGSGMSQDFVRNELQNPFQSTRGEGFGIGFYDARQFIEKAGGEMDIETALGAGTHIRMVVPTTHYRNKLYERFNKNINH